MKTQPLPFRFLLYTESVMLASCGSLAVVETLEQHRLPVQHLLILASIGLLGLMLPSGTSVKVLYTAIEISLIFYGTALGYLHILPTLYLIVVIRSCFLFELPGRLAIALLSFILFLMHQVHDVQSITQFVPPEQQQQFWMHQLAEILMFGLGLFLVLQLANTLIQELRTLMSKILILTRRADAQEDQLLEAAIASLVEDFRHSCGILIFSSITLDAVLPPQVVKTLYRIVQEALTNICKHAQAAVFLGESSPRNNSNRGTDSVESHPRQCLPSR